MKILLCGLTVSLLFVCSAAGAPDEPRTKTPPESKDPNIEKVILRYAKLEVALSSIEHKLESATRKLLDNVPDGDRDFDLVFFAEKEAEIAAANLRRISDLLLVYPSVAESPSGRDEILPYVNSVRDETITRLQGSVDSFSMRLRMIRTPIFAIEVQKLKEYVQQAIEKLESWRLDDKLTK